MAQPCAHCRDVHPSYVSVCPITGERISPVTLVNEDEILVGTVVGERYHVRDVLGQGTTGTVFAIEHVAFARAAAMKVLRPRYAPLETIVRVFHGEARTAFTVIHPCLPEIFEIGQLPDGAPYFTMELFHGETLARRTRRERLSLAAAVDVMMQILSAIEAIHGRALLLCDLRPQNVFLSHRRGCRPVVKILDFGLARMVPLGRVQQERESRRSVVDAEGGAAAMSIPCYLSPERARGEHWIEPASDLFVAAAIFYEMLAGERPFRASSCGGLLLEVAQAQARSLSELRPDVPEDLAGLVMRALAPSPRARPASARAFQDELRAIFEGARRGSARVAPASSAMPMSMPASATPRDDEASADSPLRTVPPPAADADADAAIPIDVDLGASGDDATTTTPRGAAVDAAIALVRKLPDDEVQTETLRIAPELRARMKEMDRQRETGGSSLPPPHTSAKPAR